MTDPLLLLRALVLVCVANGAPVLAKKAFGGRFAAPLDGGAVLWDGRRLFGSSKTIRGVAASVLCTAAAGVLLGLDAAIGAAFAAAAVAGDVFSSFVKRRRGLPPQARAVGLDQIPEALLPLVLLREELGLGGAAVLIVLLGFVAFEIAVSPILFRLRLRDRPH